MPSSEPRRVSADKTSEDFHDLGSPVDDSGSDFGSEFEELEPGTPTSPASGKHPQPVPPTTSSNSHVNNTGQSSTVRAARATTYTTGLPAQYRPDVHEHQDWEFVSTMVLEDNTLPRRASGASKPDFVTVRAAAALKVEDWAAVGNSNGCGINDDDWVDAASNTSAAGPSRVERQREEQLMEEVEEARAEKEKEKENLPIREEDKKKEIREGKKPVQVIADLESEESSSTREEDEARVAPLREGEGEGEELEEDMVQRLEVALRRLKAKRAAWVQWLETQEAAQQNGEPDEAVEDEASPEAQPPMPAELELSAKRTQEAQDWEYARFIELRMAAEAREQEAQDAALARQISELELNAQQYVEAQDEFDRAMEVEKDEEFARQAELALMASDDDEIERALEERAWELQDSEEGGDAKEVACQVKFQLQAILVTLEDAEVPIEEIMASRLQKTIALRAQQFDLEERLKMSVETEEPHVIKHVETLYAKLSDKIQRAYRNNFRLLADDGSSSHSPTIGEMIRAPLLSYLAPDCTSFSIRVRLPLGSEAAATDIVRNELNIEPFFDPNDSQMLTIEVLQNDFEDWLIRFQRRSIRGDGYEG